MPRITADTVAEHVRIQSAAVVDSAARLFSEFGIDAVSMGDIAKEVGLARNSLYRYFPDKNHIVAAWFRGAIQPLSEACQAILESPEDPLSRLDAWVELNLDYLDKPGHQEMIATVTSSMALADETKQFIAVGHRQIYEPLEQILVQLNALRVRSGSPGMDVATLTALIAAMTRGAAQLGSAEPKRSPIVRETLLSALHAMLSFDSGSTCPSTQ